MTPNQAILNSFFLSPRDILLNIWFLNLMLINDLTFFIFDISPIQGYKKVRLEFTNLWNDTKIPRPEAIPVKIPFSRNCLKTVGIEAGIKPVFEFRNVSSISKKTSWSSLPCILIWHPSHYLFQSNSFHYTISEKRLQIVIIAFQ